MYTKICYRVEKFYRGLIDNDLINLHNIVAKHSKDSSCKAIDLNKELIELIIIDDKFFNNQDRVNYEHRLKQLKENKY